MIFCTSSRMAPTVRSQSAMLLMTASLSSRGSDSPDWLNRQRKDIYVQQARLDSYRCRSAYKLLEIDQKHSLFGSLVSDRQKLGSDRQPGLVVLDCGAAPGSWTQVALRRLEALNETLEDPPIHTVISLDLQDIDPIPGAHCLSRCDVTAPGTLARIHEHTGGQLVDLVLSDMAPNASGVKELDMARIMQLFKSALKLAVSLSRPHGVFLCKLWAGRDQDEVEALLRRFYGGVKIVKPPSSRSDSAEVFYLARNFSLTSYKKS